MEITVEDTRREKFMIEIRRSMQCLKRASKRYTPKEPFTDQTLV
jgi:hypothetical protein